MPDQLFATNPTVIISILGITVTIVFSLVLARIVDHSINKNVKTLQELMTIRKEMNSSTPEARKMDEIITYRQKRYLKKQIGSYENLKTEDSKEAAKAILRGNSIVKNFWWGITSNLWVLGTGATIGILIVCVCFSKGVAYLLQFIL